MLRVRVNAETVPNEDVQAGIHMLVEKPISTRSRHEVFRLSERLQELQQEKQLVIGVGYQMRYLPAVQV